MSSLVSGLSLHEFEQVIAYAGVREALCEIVVDGREKVGEVICATKPSGLIRKNRFKPL